VNVLAFLLGIKADTSFFQTRNSALETYEPMFLDTFKFIVSAPEVAFLRLEVHYEGIGRVGSCTYPIQTLRGGHHFCWLNTDSGRELGLSALFVSFKKSPYKPGDEASGFKGVQTSHFPTDPWAANEEYNDEVYLSRLKARSSASLEKGHTSKPSKPSKQLPQQTHYPPQQPHYPQQTHYPPQQPHYPPHQPHYPPQQPHYPPQQPHFPPQQPHYPPQQQAQYGRPPPSPQQMAPPQQANYGQPRPPSPQQMARPAGQQGSFPSPQPSLQPASYNPEFQDQDGEMTDEEYARRLHEALNGPN